MDGATDPVVEPATEPLRTRAEGARDLPTLVGDGIGLSSGRARSRLCQSPASDGVDARETERAPARWEVMSELVEGWNLLVCLNNEDRGEARRIEY